MRMLLDFALESRVHPRVILVLATVAALGTTAVLAVVNLAAEAASRGEVSLRLLILMALGTLAFAVAQRSMTRLTAHEIERLVFRLRMGLFRDLRRAPLSALDAVGRAPLHQGLTRDTQTIVRNLPLAVLGIQQLVMLIFVAFYLLILSPTAFIMAMGFATLSVVYHLSRMQPVMAVLRQAANDDNRLFDALRDLLTGFKAVTMSRPRAEDLRSDIVALSDESRRTKSGLKRQWGLEVALIQVMFYALVGLMVFVVPLFAQDYHDVAMKATTTALFMVGPIGTVVQAVPALGNAEAALAGIAETRARLGAAVAGEAAEDTEPLEAGTQVPLREIALHEAHYAYPAVGGQPGFAIGPLSLTLRAGELVFLTGGNGSGKSTLLHVLTGLVPPSAGCLAINGAPLRPGQKQAYRNTISAVFGDYHLFQRLYGIDPSEADARGPALLADLEMADKVRIENGAFSTLDLSQGQRKRLALVVAKLEDKPILVLDEWAADQDPHFRALFYRRILPGLRARGKIILCVTHDDRWFHTADRILHMEDGRLRETPPPPAPAPGKT